MVIITMQKIIFLLLSIPAVSSATQESSWGLKSLIQEALKSNFNMLMSKNDMEEKQSLITKAYGEFDLNLSSNLSEDDQRIPSA